MITKKDYKAICQLIDEAMTMVYDRPIGNNPRLVITSESARRLKENIGELVEEETN